MKVAVYLFISFTVILSCVEAQFKKDVMRSLVFPRQSTSDCDDILPEMCTKPLVEKLTATNTSDMDDIFRFTSFYFSIVCGDCNDEYIRYFECQGNTTFIEEIRGALCAVNDDGEYCAVVLYDDLASGLFSPEFCEDCETRCDFIEYSSSLLGCCAASFACYDMFIHVGDCNTDLGEPCSGSSQFATPCSGSSQFATPMFLGIITLAVITVLF